MTKYIAIVGLVLIGSLLFVNKDKLFSKAPTAGEVVSSVMSSSSPNLVADSWECNSATNPNCSCGGRSSSCTCYGYSSGSHQCSDWGSVPATTTIANYYKLKLVYTVADGNAGGFERMYTGSISPGKGGKYAAGTTAVLTAKPIKGFKVLWDGPCGGAGNVCKIKMDSDKTINVSFEQKPGWKCSISLGGLTCSKEW